MFGASTRFLSNSGVTKEYGFELTTNNAADFTVQTSCNGEEASTGNSIRKQISSTDDLDNDKTCKIEFKDSNGSVIKDKTFTYTFALDGKC